MRFLLNFIFEYKAIKFFELNSLLVNFFMSAVFINIINHLLIILSLNFDYFIHFFEICACYSCKCGMCQCVFIKKCKYFLEI